jgi:sulfide:quinone oxidoreductase
MGAAFGFIPADKHTLQAEKWKNVWIIGDAGSVPAPKSGSVAHFMLEVVVENIG